jgi:hypothetical protein
MDFEEWWDSMDLNKIPKEIRKQYGYSELRNLFELCWKASKKETILKQNTGWGFGMDDESKLALNQIGECIGVLVRKARKAPIPPQPKGRGILGD